MGVQRVFRDPRENIWKDWSDRSKVGFLIGYIAQTPIGWIIYIPALGSCVTSIHVKFNEDILEYKIEYFKELEGEMLQEMNKQRTAEDFLYLVGNTHVDMDDCMKYEVTRIAITNDRNRHIIAYRSPIFLAGYKGKKLKRSPYMLRTLREL